MKHLYMKEFQFVEGGKYPISSQVNDFSDSDEAEDLKFLQMAMHSVKNSHGEIVETLFMLFEYETPEKLTLNLIPEDAR